MVEQRVLSRMLSEFARSLVDDFPVQVILDHLVAQIVEVLPVTSAGVTLGGGDGTRQYFAVSHPVVVGVEQLQSELGQSPAALAHRTGVPVVVADLAVDTVFPVFAQAAQAVGCAAVFTFPLRHSGGCLGALNVYRDTPGQLTAADVEAVQTLADVTTAYLLSAWAWEEVATATPTTATPTTATPTTATPTTAMKAQTLVAASPVAVGPVALVGGQDSFGTDMGTEGEHVVLRDGLTGLPNRRSLDARLTHSAQRALRCHTTAVVVFCDLDRLGRIHDVYGDETGDELVLAVAHRLSTLIGHGDTVARVGADEFVFLFEGVGCDADVWGVIEEVKDAFLAPFVLSGVTLTINARVVSSLAAPDAKFAEEHTQEITEEVIHRVEATG